MLVWFINRPTALSVRVLPNRHVGVLLEGLLVVYKSRSLVGGYHSSGYRSGGSGACRKAVTISWNNGRSKKLRTSELRSHECARRRPPDVLLVQTTLIKQFEHPMHFFDAIEITGWSSRQPRNDAEVFINIGVGIRILSDFIAGDYLDDFLSIRFRWLRYGWQRPTYPCRVSKRRHCKSGNGGNQLFGGA